MGNTVVNQPQNGNAATPVTTTGTAATGGVTNSQAAQTADVERRRKAATAVLASKEASTALGGLLPPDATGTATTIKLVGPPEAQFRRAIYKLGIHDEAALKNVQEYLTAVSSDPYQKTITTVASNVSADKEGFDALRATITTLIAAQGDLGGPSTKILATLALLTEDGKAYLRSDDVGPLPPPITKPLADYIANKLQGDTDAAKASRDAHTSLLNAIKNPHSATGGPAVDLKPKPLAGKDLDRMKAIFAEILAMFPPEKATPATADAKAVSAMQATPAQMAKLKSTLANTSPEIKDWLYAWSPPDGPHKGKTILQLMSGHMSPTQFDEMTKIADPVEQLYLACSKNRNTIGTGISSVQMIVDFLRAHNNDEGARNRVKLHTLLMQQFVQFTDQETRKIIMRLILTGSEQETAVDKVHAAVDKGDKTAAIQAIYELGQDPSKLKDLRTDLIFVNRLRSLDGGSWTAGAQKGDFNGVQVSAYELFLRMCGEDPHKVKEAGSTDKQSEVNPDAKEVVPLTPKERGDLDLALYTPWAKLLADELNSTWTKDSKIIGWLEDFQKKAAEPWLRDMLRRAQEAPGPTMANRIQACGCDVRHRMQKGLSEGPLMQAERILGFVTDQATTGVIGGTGTLATDNKPKSGEGKVGLEQALRETVLESGEVLSAVIHKAATDIADELNSTFYINASTVRKHWNNYCGKVNQYVLADLREKTGLPRVWACELLANAFLQVGGGTLQSKLNEKIASKDPALITDMGMQVSDIEARKTLAQQGVKLDNSGNEQANNDVLAGAKAKVEQEAKVDVFKTPAKELFDGLSTLSHGPEDDVVLKALGEKLKNGLAMSPITGAAVAPAKAATPTVDSDIGAKPGGPVHPGEAAPTDFAGFYKKEYGIDPRRHAVEVAKSYATAGRTPQQVGELLQVTDASLFAPPVAPPETLEITAANRTLVGPDFSVDRAKQIAERIWNLLHDNGQMQFIRHEIDGRTQEEQRLINIAFRQKSAGIDLVFYLQQHLTQQKTNNPGLYKSVGGGGVGDADKRSLQVHGEVAETEAAIEVAAKGKLSLETELSSLIKANNMDGVYKAIENATPDERRAILANSDLMTQLRGFGDDSYEWKRIYKGLTGELDLYDKLDSHAHGKHGFIGGGFEGTDEKGMKDDIAGHAKKRREEIRKQVLAGDPYKGKMPSKPEDVEAFNKKVQTLLLAEFQQHAENPSIRAILTDELSGTELGDAQGQLMNGGEESKVASLLHDSDLTENEEKIIADIKKMTPAERAKRRKDPQFMAQLQKACGSQETWRDAMIALESTEDGSKGENDDNFSKLEKASRGDDQDKFEFKYEEKEVIEALSRLSSDEYKRLMADPRMQAQVLKSLEKKPELLAMARQMMAYNAADAGKMTGLTIGEKPDPAKGIYSKDEVERLAFLKFSAENQLRAGASRAWLLLLQAGVAVYNMKLKPGMESPETPPQPQLPANAPTPTAPANATGPANTAAPANSAAPTNVPAADPNAAPAKADEVKPPDPKAAADAVDKRLRGEILADLKPAIVAATTGWGEQKAESEDDPKKHGETKKIGPEAQQTIIEKAITHDEDPSNHIFMESTGWLHISDDEDAIKDAIKKASDDKLMRQWTTVAQQAPNESPSLKTKYEAWKTLRQKAGEDQSKQPTAAGGKPPELRKPKVGSDEWNAKVAFKAHVIDTSDVFEDLLLKWTGGLGADDTKMNKSNDHIRDNKEWLEWRTIVRDRIPNLDRKKMGEVIGAAADTEAMAVLEDPNAKTLSDTLGALQYDEEKYLVSRGENSNYNMDHLTAGGEGLALDNSMAAYRREVMTGIISDPKDTTGGDYGHLSAEEQAKIAEAKSRFNQNHEQFTEAKSKVATVAGAVVAIIVTAVVTVLTAGTATGPLATILIGALTAGAASAGTQLTKEAIQGTDFDLGKEGLQAIARDTIMGAVTAGTTYYAGKIANAMFGVKSAAEQAARIGAIVKDPSFLAAMGKSMAENSIQSGMQGLFETGMAAFDPAMWMHGWNEGWHRASKAAGDRAKEIPGEMLKAAIVAALTHSAGSAIGKLKGGGHADDGWHGQHAKLGNRMNVLDRSKLVAKTMGKGIEDGLVMGGTEILLDEKTYRAEGQSADEFLGKLGNSVSTTMQQNAGNLHIADAAGYARHKAGMAELAKHGSTLSETEKKIYTQIITSHGENGTTVMSVAEFKAAREGAPREVIAKHEADGGRKLTAEETAAYKEYLHSAPDLKEYLKRLDAGPSAMPGHNIPPPPKVQFADAKACKSERDKAKEVADKLAAAAEAAKAHSTDTADLHTQRDALMKEASLLVKEIQAAVKTPEDAKRLGDLVTKLNMTSSELGNALADVNAAGAMTVLHDQLKDALQAAEASPNDPVKHQALHALVVAAAVKEATGPTAISDGAAIAKKKIAELKDALEALKTERDNAARKKGHEGPPSNAENELKNPETKETKETKENKETKVNNETKDPAKKDDPQQQGQQKLSESDQQKLQWFIDTHGSEKGPALFEKWKKQRFGEDANLTPEQRKLIADRVKKEAGESIGDTVDHSFQSDEQADIERWQSHALEDVASDPDIMKGIDENTPEKKKKKAQDAQDASDKVRKWLSDPDFRHWYDVWMSMPDRMVVDAKGEAKINLPAGIPAPFAQHLHEIAKAGNVGLMTRALEVSKRIEAEFPGLDPDPDSEAWKKARPRLVEMLGEAQVHKYETECRPEKLSAEQKKKIDDRVSELVKPTEMARIQELCPGCQIFLTGSGGQLGKAVSDVTDLDLLVVVPAGTPQKARIELEHALQALKVKRPDGVEMPVDAKVMTHEQYMGFSMLPTAEGRTPMTNIRIDDHSADVPGSGASGGDLHNHIMGVPATQYFVDKIGAGNSTLTLEKLAKDVADLTAKEGKPAVTPAVQSQINAALVDIANARKAGMPPDVVEARARRALDAIFAANPNTPFDHTYDIRDIAVQKHIDPNGKFENYATDVITNLHDQGVTYSEQSVSLSKLEKRFTPEVMEAARKKAAEQGKSSQLEFLVMAPTSDSLAGGKKTPEQLTNENNRLRDILMRKDVKGMDVAGPEAQPFTDTGMDWFVDKYKMLVEVAKAKGEKMVLRPHVGEGYDPNHTGEHVEIAQANLKLLIKTLKDLGYNGSGDVIIRFGHATHATPQMLADMASIGIIVEANIGSNLATGSVLRATDHPLLANMYYGVSTVLATDAQGVMDTTLTAEYRRAAALIQQFRDGKPLELNGKKILFKELTPKEKERFSVEWLQKQLAEYRKKASEPVSGGGGGGGGGSQNSEGSTKTDTASNAAAAHVPDSNFKGNHDTNNAAAIGESLPTNVASAAGVLGPEFRVNGRTVEVDIDGKKVTVDINVSSGSLGSSVAKHDFKVGKETAQITISGNARTQDIARAIAHELAEIRALMRGVRMGGDGDVALKKGSSSMDMTAHDYGRAAELRVLTDQLAKANTPESRADIQKEINALMEHLGLDGASIKPGPAGDRARLLLGADVIGAVEGQIGRITLTTPVDLSTVKEGDTEAIRAKMLEIKQQLKEKAAAITSSAKAEQDAKRRLNKAADDFDIEAKKLPTVQALLTLGREHNIDGLQSRQQLKLKGHEHDSLIYKVLVAVGAELRNSGTPELSLGSPQSAVDAARPGYDSALNSALASRTQADFPIGGRRFVVDPAGYILVPGAAKGSEQYKKGPGGKTVEQLKQIGLRFAAEIQKGKKDPGLSDQDVQIFLAATLAETRRNNAAEATNRLVFAAGGSDPVFGKMPMTDGGTSSAPRDRSLDGSRAGLSWSSGEATDKELALIKEWFKTTHNQDLAAYIDAAKSVDPNSPEIDAMIEADLRRMLLAHINNAN